MNKWSIFIIVAAFGWFKTLKILGLKIECIKCKTWMWKCPEMFVLWLDERLCRHGIHWGVGWRHWACAYGAWRRSWSHHHILVTLQAPEPVHVKRVLRTAYTVPTGQGKLEKVREFEWSGKVRENIIFWKVRENEKLVPSDVRFLG